MPIEVHDDFERSSVDAALSEVTTDTDSVPLVRLKARQQIVATHIGTWLEPVAKVTGVLGVRPRFEFFPYRSTPVSGFNAQGWASGQRAHYSYDFLTWHPIATLDRSVANVLKFRHDTPFEHDTVYIARSWPTTLTITGNRISALESLHPTKVRPAPSALAFTPSLTTGFPAQEFIAAEISAATNELGGPVPATPLYAVEIDDSAFAPKLEDAIIVGGVHACEDVGLVVMWEFVNWFLGESSEAIALRKRYRLLLYPILNTAGKYAGHYRAAPGGNVDANSQWRTSSSVYDYVPKAKAAMFLDLPQSVRWCIDFHAAITGKARWSFTQYSNWPEMLQLREAVNGRLPLGVAEVGIYGTVTTSDPDAKNSFGSGFSMRSRDTNAGLGAFVSITAETDDKYGPVSPTVMQPYAEALGLALYDRTQAWVDSEDPPVEVEIPAITASQAIVRNLRTGQVYYSKEGSGNKIASLTKIMTVHVALQRYPTESALKSKLIEIVASDLTGSGTGANLQLGDVLSLYGLIANALLPSSNNACMAIARVLGQEMLDEESATGDPRARFLTEMRDTAASLGMTETTYINSHGNTTGNLGSAEDVATIAEAAWEGSAVYRQITGMTSYQLELVRDGVPTWFTISKSADQLGVYPGVLGGKSGTLAGVPTYNMAVFFGADNGDVIITVIIGSTSSANRIADQNALLDALQADFPELSLPPVDPPPGGNRATFTARVRVIAPQQSGLPSWRIGQAVGEWREIPNTAMSLYPPTVNPFGKRRSAKIDSWNGLCIDTRSSTIWNLASGGHDDYYGNDVQKFTLGADQPQWIEVLPSSPESAVINNADRYADGRPTSSHTYWSQHVIESRNLAVRFGIGATAGTGFPRKEIAGFDVRSAIGSDGWTPPGAFPQYANYNTQAPQCMAPNGDVYMFHENYDVILWRNLTNSLSRINTQWPPATMRLCASAYDAARNRIFLIKSAGAWTFDPATGTFTARTITGPAAARAHQNSQAMFYSAHLDAFILAGSDNPLQIVRVDPQTFEATVIPTVGTPAPVIPGTDGGKPYSRFLLAPALGGAAWIPTYTDNCWFVRLY